MAAWPVWRASRATQDPEMSGLTRALACRFGGHRQSAATRSPRTKHRIMTNGSFTGNWQRWRCPFSRVGPVVAGSERYRFDDGPLSGAASGTFSIGRRTLIALSDGVLFMPRTFLGTAEQPRAGDEALRRAYGHSRLPLGCFFLPGTENVLVDTGFGPVQQEGVIVGGRLLENLAQHRIRPEDAHIVALTHLHGDHVGWVGDATGRPVFSNAKFVLGRGDWEYFMSSDDLLETHIRESLQWLERQGRVVLQDGEAAVAPGITRLSAPGRTPGHSLFVVHDGRANVAGWGTPCIARNSSATSNGRLPPT